jgi:thymidylate kinase
MTSRVIVQISGPEHSKKTTLAVTFAKFLSENGVKVTVPPDPQAGEKMEESLESLVKTLRSADIEIMVMETQSARVRS